MGKIIQNKTLSSLTSDIKRGISSYYFQNEGSSVIIVNIRDLENGKVNTKGLEYVKVKNSPAVDKAKLNKGDIIISIKGSSFRAAIMSETINNYVISANLIAFKINHEILPELVVSSAQSHQAQEASPLDDPDLPLAKVKFLSSLVVMLVS